MESAQTWEDPVNEKVKELKIGKSDKHHWIREHAKKYSDVANMSFVHLQLTDGHA